MPIRSPFSRQYRSTEALDTAVLDAACQHSCWRRVQARKSKVRRERLWRLLVLLERRLFCGDTDHGLNTG